MGFAAFAGAAVAAVASATAEPAAAASAAASASAKAAANRYELIALRVSFLERLSPGIRRIPAVRREILTGAARG